LNFHLTPESQIWVCPDCEVENG
jgi:hypothetical protein